MSQVFDILERNSDKDLAVALTRSFQEVEEAFLLSQWKLAGVSVGHFVEASRRLIELKLFSDYTPISKALPPLNMDTLKKYENANGDEGYRLHVPRALCAIYGLRNKRGYGHLSLELANKVDVTIMVETCRWVLAEFLRIESEFPTDVTDKLVSETVERQSPLIWKTGGVERILQNGLSLRDKVLILLYHKRTVEIDALVRATEAKTAYLKRTVKSLHVQRLLEFDETKSTCVISPTGNRAAESILINLLN